MPTSSLAPGRVRPVLRLRRSADIRAVLRRGRRRSGARVQVFVADGPEQASDQGVRVAFVAGRRVGGAVARNRAKRLMREAWRSLDVAEGSLDLVVMALPRAADGDMSVVRGDLVGCLSALDMKARSSAAFEFPA
ncbi:MAG TPA: ribonuclease P protein component [Actinobacteria bacterium]|nr:ribonuclease P protein component [Actinomycetota bacterium]